LPPLREKITSVTHATPGTETTHAHTLGQVPGYIALTSKGNGTVYLATAADASNFYVRGSAASLTFDALVMLDHTLIK